MEEEETPEERATRIFAEDEIIRQKRVEREEKEDLEDNYQQRLKALDKYNIDKLCNRESRSALNTLLRVMLNHSNTKFNTFYEEREYMDLLRRIYNRVNKSDEKKIGLFVREYGLFDYYYL